MIRVLVLLAALVASPSAAHAGNYGKFNVTASHVHVISLNLPAGWVTLETYDLVPTRGADTVIHLMDARGVEVGWSDDYQGSTRSLIRYNVPGPGWYQLVIRSYSTDSGGTCSVAMNSTPLETNVPFGGAHVTTNTISTDIVQTALVHQGTTDTVVYGLDSGGHLLASNDDSGVGYASKLGGAYAKVVVGTYGWTAGSTRVYVNDAANDHDGDGLGAELEKALCTCDTVTATPPSGVGCPALPCQPPYTRHPEDSDGDGIRDDYEAFGVEGTDPYDYPQHLLKWGANPAHKDIFIEMDYAPPPAPSLLPPDQALRAAQAYVREGTAPYLKNRDGGNGIALHVDIGLDDPSCGMTCGDWGGHGAVHDVPCTDDSQCSVSCNLRTSRCVPDYIRFAKVRRGIFHYGRGIKDPGSNPILGWETMVLPRFRGHPEWRDNALGVFHGQTEETEVHDGVQG